jgi:hypothetical protein
MAGKNELCIKTKKNATDYGVDGEGTRAAVKRIREKRDMIQGGPNEGINVHAFSLNDEEGGGMEGREKMKRRRRRENIVE